MTCLTSPKSISIPQVEVVTLHPEERELKSTDEGIVEGGHALDQPSLVIGPTDVPGYQFTLHGVW